MKVFGFVNFCGLLALTLGAGYQDKSVMEYLTDNGFDTFVRALKAVGLEASLQGHGPFTIFAPTEAAFAKLDPNYLVSLTNHDNQMIKVLKYHVVPEYILVPLVTTSEVKQTLEGQELNVTKVAGTLVLNNNATVDASREVTLNNGVVQPIDYVLIPPIMGTKTIAQILLEDDARFQDTFIGMFLSNLIGTLGSGDFTFFAPIDTAWAPYKDAVLAPSSPNSSYYYHELMKYHIVPGGRRAKQMSDGQKLFTLHGTFINVQQDLNGGLMLNHDAHVIEADIPASNGFMHVVDKLLLPNDLFPKAPTIKK